jgi:hypothetical protein
MALVVEDGTGKPDANSFVTRAEYIDFAALRGVTVANDVAADVELVKATDKILTMCFKGSPTVAGQALPFPRHEENYKFELVYPDDKVPVAVKRGQMLFAMAVHEGVDLAPNFVGGATIKREKIGPIETEYNEDTEYNSPTVPLAMSAFAPFTCGQGGRVSVLRV